MAFAFFALLAVLPLIAAKPLRAGLAERSRPAYNTANPKRGLPYNDPTSNVQDWSKYSQVQWAYNWDSQTDANFPFSTLEFYPMLWGPTSDHTGKACSSHLTPPLARKPHKISSKCWVRRQKKTSANKPQSGKPMPRPTSTRAPTISSSTTSLTTAMAVLVSVLLKPPLTSSPT